MYDVAWCPSGGNVAASLSNGGVAIWDLHHLASNATTIGRGKGQQQGGAAAASAAAAIAGVRGEDTGKIIGRHDRSVNRLCWNPFDHGMLLSGSQARHKVICSALGGGVLACVANGSLPIVRPT